MTNHQQLDASAEVLELDGIPITLDDLREASEVYLVEFSNSSFRLQSLPSKKQIGGSPCPEDSSSP